MERETMKVSKPVDEQELANFKRSERITLIIWAIVGIAAIVFAALYFTVVATPGFLSISIGKWDTVTSTLVKPDPNFNWDANMATDTPIMLSFLDLLANTWSASGSYIYVSPTGNESVRELTYLLSNTQMLGASFYLQIISVALFAVALIMGVVAYVSKKKLSALPVGFGLLSMAVSMMSFGYLIVGSTSTTISPGLPLLPDLVYGSIYTIQIVFMVIFYVLGAAFCAIAPYVIDHRASALYDIGLKH